MADDLIERLLNDPRTGLIALAATLDVVNGMPTAAKIIDAGVAEIDHLRAALAAAEAERDRAMHACEQIGGRVAAAEARAEKAERERDAARALLKAWMEHYGAEEMDTADVIAANAALMPARNEKED